MMMNASAAYYRACQFEEVASDIDKTERDYLVPIIVNCAFACELFLKAILKVQGAEIPKSHDLEYLFLSLDAATQENIKESAKICSWECFLSNAKTAFENWRYAHEQPYLSISISDMFRFAASLHKFADTRFSTAMDLTDEDIAELDEAW